MILLVPGLIITIGACVVAEFVAEVIAEVVASVVALVFEFK